MSDHKERACTYCGDLLHHEDDCTERDAPGMVECSECGILIPDDDTGNVPYCARCWNMLDYLSSLCISRY